MLLSAMRAKKNEGAVCVTLEKGDGHARQEGRIVAARLDLGDGEGASRFMRKASFDGCRCHHLEELVHGGVQESVGLQGQRKEGGALVDGCEAVLVVLEVGAAICRHALLAPRSFVDVGLGTGVVALCHRPWRLGGHCQCCFSPVVPSV